MTVHRTEERSKVQLGEYGKEAIRGSAYKNVQEQGCKLTGFASFRAEWAGDLIRGFQIQIPAYDTAQIIMASHINGN